jgi:uncharacterized membrane protein (DUF4010 family)
MPYNELLATLIPIATALGCGLLIGIERERRKRDSDVGAFAGLRTFAITALLGALVQRLEMPWLVVCGGLLIVALVTIAYARSATRDVGTTTEIALFVTYVIGVTAAINPSLAATVTVVVAILLLTRTPLHRFATETLTQVEMRDGMLLLSVALIVLPLLPDQEFKSFAAINPHRIGLVVVMLLSIQTAAHVSLRIFGQKLGVALSGFLSGFVSSTATFAAMAMRAKEFPESTTASACSALLSQVASMLQLIALVAVLNPSILIQASLSIGLGAVVLTLTSFVMLRGIGTGTESEVQRRRMFNPIATLAFVALLTLFTVIIGWIDSQLGPSAAKLTAMFASLVDLHAASAAVLSAASNRTIPASELIVTLLLVLTVNIASKAAISFSGGRSFFVRIDAALLIAILATWVPLFTLWHP